MDRLGEKIGSYFGVSWCVFAELTKDLEYLECYGWNDEGINSIEGNYRLQDYLSEDQIAKNNAGEVTIICDSQTDPNTNKEAYGKLNIRSLIMIPISRDDHWNFQLIILDNKVRKWLDCEVNLMKEISERIWTKLEQVRANRALCKRTHALDEVNRLKEDIIESISDCFFVLDRDFCFTYINKAAYEMYDLPKEAIIGRKIEDVFPGLIDISISKFRQVLQEKTKKHYEIYSKVIKKWIDMGVYPMRGGGVSVYIQDIADRKKAQESLRESEKKALALVDELEEVDKNKNEFLNMLSHELRNPLAAMSGGIALLKFVNENEKGIKTIKMLERQCKHLSKLVDDLIDIARIDSKKVKLEIEIADLNIIIKDTIEDMKQQFEEKGIKLLYDGPKSPVMANVDSLRITQCVGNILRNAFKFTGVNGVVRISLKIQGKNVLMEIEDDGIGIRSEMLERIFEAFRQESNPFSSRDNMGLGLGLYIVREYMEMHNGSISASSQGIGKGSTFTLRLPLE